VPMWFDKVASQIKLGTVHIPLETVREKSLVGICPEILGFPRKVLLSLGKINGILKGGGERFVESENF